MPDLQGKVELALANDYERILDEIKNNYDPRKLQSHIQKLGDADSDTSGSLGSKRAVPGEPPSGPASKGSPARGLGR